MDNDVNADVQGSTGRRSVPPGRALDVRGVTKSYGRVRVLDRLNLTLGWGEVLSVLGPNGSGKTTLVKILATLTIPDAGSVRVAGFDVDRSGGRVRRAIGVVMHDPMLYADLTARENLLFFCRMFGLDGAEARIAETVERVGLTHRLDQRVGTLSHGMQKRFSIARALLHRPKVLLMDEPESGLDQSAVSLLREVVETTKAGGGAVLLVTHNLEQAAALGDRVAILSRGRMVHVEEFDSERASPVDGERADDKRVAAIRAAYLRHTADAEVGR